MRTSPPSARCTYWSLLVGVALCAVLVGGAFPALAVGTAPSLGTAESFAVLGGSTVTNTGPSVTTGNLGVSPGTAITGFPPGLVGGTIHAADAVALQAQGDVTTAYLDLAGQPCDVDLTSQDLGGLTLTPGVYCFPSTSAQLTGALILDAEGDPNAVFIFQIGSTLTTASNASVLVINGAQECNVFWQVGSSATLGTDTAFVGNILALTSISLTTRASVSGRTLARNGAVMLDTNGVTGSVCDVPPAIPIAPTLGKAFGPAGINAGGVSILTITLSNPNDSPADLTAALIDTLPGGVVIAATPNASTTCAGGGAVIADAGGTTVTLPETRSIPAGTGTTAGICTVTVDVTAALGGSYLNTLAVDALQTSHGANTAPAIATLTVAPPPTTAPTLGKAFSPATINAGEVSTLTLTLINPNTTAAYLTVPLKDTLPSGVVIAAIPNASTTCPGTGAVFAAAGGTKVKLPSTRSIPAGTVTTAGTCTVTVDVTAAEGGSYYNILPANALQTWNGNNAVPAIATLTVAHETWPPGDDVVWTSPVKVAVSGNTITKNAGCNGCWDAGAMSQQTIVSGDGFVEFAVSSGAALTAGLSTGNGGVSASEITFGLRFFPSYVEVRESGVWKASWTIAAGDLHKVAVRGGVVKYFLNGSRKYTSTAAPAYPLLVDATIETGGSAVENAVIAGASGGSGGGGGDTIAPTVAITAPANGAAVSGTVTVSAIATDSVGVTGVQLTLDGANLGAADTTAPYAVTWDTTAVPNGTHTLTAVAQDAAGNTTTSAPITVTVSNGGLPAGNVVWTSPVKVAVSGNTITKNAGCNGCWDAGASSQQTIVSGDGFVEFAVSSGAALTAGLSTGNGGTSAGEIRFGLRFFPSYVEVRESGVWMESWTIAAGDLHKVAVEGGVVTYFQNGTPRYTSTAAPAYPLLVDATLETFGSAVQGAVLGTTP